MQKIFFKLFVLRKNRHYLSHTNWLSISVLTVSFLLSASRIVGLYVNYSAPISTWMHVSHLGFNHPELYSKEALWDQGKLLTRI